MEVDVVVWRKKGKIREETFDSIDCGILEIAFQPRGLEGDSHRNKKINYFLNLYRLILSYSILSYYNPTL